MGGLHSSHWGLLVVHAWTREGTTPLCSRRCARLNERRASLPCRTQANNFMGVVGVDRTVGGATYRLHSGFAATYFVTMREAFVSKLKAALAKHPSSDVYMNGHSRGGAMATLATFDLVAETGAEVRALTCTRIARQQQLS